MCAVVLTFATIPFFSIILGVKLGVSTLISIIKATNRSFFSTVNRSSPSTHPSLVSGYFQVLEALNRLLDHNRELYLSETQETIKPHANFRLFATQNPPGAYGGRKPLSRAFRNRFMEVRCFSQSLNGTLSSFFLALRGTVPRKSCWVYAWKYGVCP